jgi:hypothetical protein
VNGSGHLAQKSTSCRAGGTGGREAGYRTGRSGGYDSVLDEDNRLNATVVAAIPHLSVPDERQVFLCVADLPGSDREYALLVVSYLQQRFQSVAVL